MKTKKESSKSLPPSLRWIWILPLGPLLYLAVGFLLLDHLVVAIENPTIVPILPRSPVIVLHLLMAPTVLMMTIPWLSLTFPVVSVLVRLVVAIALKSPFLLVPMVSDSGRPVTALVSVRVLVRTPVLPRVCRWRPLVRIPPVDVAVVPVQFRGTRQPPVQLGPMPMTLPVQFRPLTLPTRTILTALLLPNHPT